MPTAPAAHPAKADIRAEVLARRDRLTAPARAAAAEAIARRALAIVAAVGPRLVAAYLPIRSECDSRPIIERLAASGMALALPAVVDSSTIVFRRYAPGAPLTASGFGTLAPPPDQPVVDPELIIIPLVAFDRTGTRLGHGRGHYDRALARLAARGLRPRLVGIAFAVQEVEVIPGEPHDVRLDWIVTEKETLDMRPGK